VYSTSATSAPETQVPSSSSQIACGYRIGVQASSLMARDLQVRVDAAIAARPDMCSGQIAEPGALR
jgi:hypothetical protein